MMGELAGGIGLFLLGMWLLTEGLKAHLLEAGARVAIDMRAMERLLRPASLTRRVVEQAVKAARALVLLDAGADVADSDQDTMIVPGGTGP